VVVFGIVAVAWHCSRTPLLLRNVALLQQAATFLLQNGCKPQNSAVFSATLLLQRGVYPLLL
jgi:hypothetical protein